MHTHTETTLGSDASNAGTNSFAFVCAPPAGVHHTRMIPASTVYGFMTPMKMESMPTPDTCAQTGGARAFVCVYVCVC